MVRDEPSEQRDQGFSVPELTGPDEVFDRVGIWQQRDDRKRFFGLGMLDGSGDRGQAGAAYDLTDRSADQAGRREQQVA